MKTKPEIAFDASAFWQLQATPRFPLASEQWQQPIVVNTGRNGSDRLITRMGTLMRGREFALGVTQKLTAPEWRLLYYLADLDFDRVMASGFDPREQVADACAPDGWLTDVPEEWNGVTSTEDLCRSLWQKFTAFTQQEAQTAVAIVAFFRAISLEKHEVLATAWHDRLWIEGFITHVRLSP